MRRTQIYLDDQQDAQLTTRAAVTARTKSALIREAIDAYLGQPPTAEEALTRFRVAADAAFGTAPYLPAGDAYVRNLRAAEVARREDLERRRHGG